MGQGTVGTTAPADCWARHFGWVCVVCAGPLSAVARADGGRARLEFLKHPFFNHERMCPCHVKAGDGGTGRELNVRNANLIAAACPCLRFLLCK